MSPWIVLIALLLFAAFLLFRWDSKRRKRRALLQTPLTAQQRETMERLVPLVRHIPPSLRRTLEGKMNLFFDQVTFRGPNGLEVTEDMKVSIAAQACLLIVNSPDWYDTLRNVLIYPSTFVADRDTRDGELVHEGSRPLLGESWARGPVVLSWDGALQGGLDAHDGYNVVFHEFAHQLDALSGQTNGLPRLRKGQTFAGWEKAMLDAYNRQVGRLERGERTLIDPYGATNHQEFFAEAIVTFLEKPRELKSDDPALYSQFAQLLALDPVEWEQ